MIPGLFCCDVHGGGLSFRHLGRFTRRAVHKASFRTLDHRGVGSGAKLFWFQLGRLRAKRA